MLRLSLVIALFIAVLAVIFALQNTVPVVVNFLPWEFQGSLALVLLLTLALGVIVGLLVSVPSIIRRSRRISHQQKIIENLEANHVAPQAPHRTYTEPPEQAI
jgi:uncharacterized integral membrane protein